MVASREDIEGWFDRGVKEGATHLIVVCDGFDHDDYPAWVHPGQDFWESYDRFDGKNMQSIMEVYDLAADKATQMKEYRAMRLPVRPAPTAEGKSDV